MAQEIMIVDEVRLGKVSTEIMIVDEVQLGRVSTAATRLAATVVIDGIEMAQFWTDERNKLRQQIKMLEEDRKTLTRPLDESKARIMEKYAPHIQQMTQAVCVIDSEIIRWTGEQRRIAHAEQAFLDAEARAARIAAEKEAETARLAAEAAQRAADPLNQASVEAAAQAKQAAEVAQVAAELIVSPPAAQAVKPAGIAVSGTLEFEVVDMRAFLSYVLDRGLLNLVAVDTVTTRNFVRALGGEPIPGLRVFRKDKVKSTVRRQ